MGLNGADFLAGRSAELTKAIHDEVNLGCRGFLHENDVIHKEDVGKAGGSSAHDNRFPSLLLHFVTNHMIKSLHTLNK